MGKVGKANIFIQNRSFRRTCNLPEEHNRGTFKRGCLVLRFNINREARYVRAKNLGLRARMIGIGSMKGNIREEWISWDIVSRAG